jgi:hypothetical protein
LTLLAVNTNSGSTTISAGTLALTGAAGMPKTSVISIAGGATFSVSGMTSTFVLGSSQTLSNAAAATGIINGSLNTTASSTVAVSYTNGTPSLSVANGTLTLTPNTVFQISITGPVLASGTYKIISKGGFGSVAGTAPSTVTVFGGAGTSSLSISNNELYLTVLATPNAPVILPPYVNGLNQLVLAVPTQLGFNYLLLSTTNLNPPVVWTTNSTTAGTGGNITNTVPVGSVPPNQFFRYQVH